MRYYGESRSGVADRTLVESALARPEQAAAYENADLVRQAAIVFKKMIFLPTARIRIFFFLKAIPYVLA